MFTKPLLPPPPPQEPIMKVDVQSPEEYLGEVIGDINSRRGQISELGMSNPGSNFLSIHSYPTPNFHPTTALSLTPITYTTFQFHHN